MARVIVLGAGGLSLGLICPILVETDHTAILASRIAASADRERLERIRIAREIRLVDMRSRDRGTVPLGDFLDTSTDVGRSAFLELAADADVRLLVTAARDGFGAVADVLRGEPGGA